MSALAQKALQLSSNRIGSDTFGDVTVQDITLAFFQTNVVSPQNLLDPYDIDPSGDNALEAFDDWFVGPSTEAARSSARPTRKFIEMLKKVRGEGRTKKLSKIIPEYAMMEEGKAVKKEVEDETVSDEDWIQFLIRMQLDELAEKDRRNTGSGGDDKTANLLTSTMSLKLKSSVLSDYLPFLNDVNINEVSDKNQDEDRFGDYMVIGPTPANLSCHLPYSLDDTCAYSKSEGDKPVESQSEQNAHQEHKDQALTELGPTETDSPVGRNDQDTNDHAMAEESLIHEPIEEPARKSTPPAQLLDEKSTEQKPPQENNQQ